MCSQFILLSSTPSLNESEAKSEVSLDVSECLNTSSIEFNTENPCVFLSELKAKNADRLIIAHININFLEKNLNP